MQINYSGLTLLPSELTGEFTAASPELPKDRKSTRLNSSHSQISYAVFCLKKKKSEIEDGIGCHKARSTVVQLPLSPWPRPSQHISSQKRCMSKLSARLV